MPAFRQGTLYASAFSEPSSPVRPAVPLSEISLPADLGAVESVHEFEGSSLSVLILQDAHAVPDAQRSLYRMTSWLVRERGARTVALEGASGRLDALLLRTFPDRALAEQTLLSYLDSGELSGAAAAAVQVSDRALFQGIEDEGLYRESVDAYLEAQKYSESLLRALKNIRDGLEEETVRASGNLQTAVKLLDGRLPFDEQLVFLSRLVPLDFHSRTGNRFKHVRMLLNQVSGQNESMRRDLQMEARALAASALRWDLDEARQRELAKWRQGLETEEMSAEDCVRKLRGLARRLGRPLQVSPAMQTSMQALERLEQTRSSLLASEWTDFQTEILSGALAGERGLWQSWQNWFLFDKWVRLELSPAEYRRFSSGEGGLDARFARLRASAGAENPWDRFYRLALRRDEIFSAKLTEFEKNPERRGLVLLAAGGFHTAGLEEQLTKMKISHARVIPAVPSVPETTAYTDVMKGRVSWKNFLRAEGGNADVYQAFQASVVQRLSGAYRSDPAQGRAVFLQWRTDVLKALHAEGRSAGAHAYTRFIDRGLYGFLPEEEKSAFEEQWQNALKRFLDQMRQLERRGRLTPEAVAGLPARSGVVQWPAVKGFVPGARVPAAWLEGEPEHVSSAAPVFEDGLAGAVSRAELRSGDAGFDDDARARPEIILEEPLEGVWTWFWRTLPLVGVSVFGAALYFHPAESWLRVAGLSLMAVFLYVIAGGSVLMVYERDALKDHLRNKRVPAPRTVTVDFQDGTHQTIVEAPELFVSEPGERLAVEKFVNTALHAAEILASDVIAVRIGAKTVFVRGDETPSWESIREAAEAFDYGTRPDFEGPILLRVQIFHRPAERGRSELRAEPLSREESLRRFSAMRELMRDPALLAPLREDEPPYVKTRPLNEALMQALNGLRFREGYHLQWNTLDYHIVRDADDRPVGNLSLEFVIREGKLQAGIGYDLIPAEQGRGIVRDLHVFLGQALPEEIAFFSEIDNIPTLLSMLDSLLWNADAGLPIETLRELRLLRLDYDIRFQENFTHPDSQSWRRRTAQTLADIFRKNPLLMPASDAMDLTQTGRLNRALGGAATMVYLRSGVLEFKAVRGSEKTEWESLERTLRSRAFVPGESVRLRVEALRQELENWVDEVSFNPQAPNESPDSYASRVLDFARESGIAVREQGYASWRLFYAAQFGNLADTSRSSFRALMRGEFKKASGNFLLAVVTLSNLIWTGVGVPAILVDDEKGELKQLIFLYRLHFYLPGIAFSSAAYDLAVNGLSIGQGIHALIAALLLYATASAGAFIFNRLSKGFSGHEMTHVFQFSLMERFRRELNLPVNFMEVYTEYFTRADLEAPPMPSITKAPPTQAQLKDQIRLIASGFLRQAEALEERINEAQRSELRALPEDGDILVSEKLFRPGIRPLEFFAGAYESGDIADLMRDTVQEREDGSAILALSYQGQDVEEKLARLAERLNKDVRVATFAPEQVLPEENYDEVLSLFEAEFADRKRMLARVKPALKPGGHAAFLMLARESALMTFFRDYLPLYDTVLEPLLAEGLVYARSEKTTASTSAWLDAVSLALQNLVKAEPKPRPLRALTQEITELDTLLTLGEKDRLPAFESWLSARRDARAWMERAVSASLDHQDARLLASEAEQTGFEDVYVQPFHLSARVGQPFSGYLAGWILRMSKPDPGAASAGRTEPVLSETGELPPLYILHEIGNLLAGFRLVENSLDPRETGGLARYYGPEYFVRYKALMKRFEALRSSQTEDKRLLTSALVRDMAALFSPEAAAPVIARIASSGHAEASEAAEAFKNASSWMYELLSAFLAGESERLQRIRPYLLIRDAVSPYLYGVEYTGGEAGLNIRIETYPLTLYRVLRNLTVNAVHATDPSVTGHRRAVGLSVETMDPAQNDGYPVRIQVKDNGTGIPEDVLPRIFEPFFTTKGEAGTGVGLAMVKHSVEKVLGGRLRVETVPGQGTVFTVDLPETALRSELRQSRDFLMDRREWFRKVGGTAAGSILAASLDADAQPPKAQGPVRKLELPQNPFLRSAALRDTYRDTQAGLSLMRTADGLPYNQALTAARPSGGWMKSSDFGFLWTAELAAALAHAQAPLGERGNASTAAAVTGRIRQSLAQFQKIVDAHGLRVNGVNTGILPEVLTHERGTVKAETVEMPGRKGERGTAYAAYDMALTHARLKLVAEVFRGGYVRGLEDAGIVRTAEALLAAADYRPFLDDTGTIRNQVFQKPREAGVILAEARIDNRHTEARDFFLIPEVFGKPGDRAAERRRAGLAVLAKLKHEWILAEASGGESVPIGRGDQNLTGWTEYEGLQFLDPAEVSPGVLALSARHYFRAAQLKAASLKHEFAVTAPGTGVRPEVYEPFGLRKPDVTVPAGVFLALTSGLPEAVQNAEKLVREAKRQRSYVPGWGLADAYDPKTGRAHNTKRIFMNQALIVESLAAPFFRYVAANLPDYETLREEFRAFDKANPAPASVKNRNLLKSFDSTGFFTQTPGHPSNREFFTPKGALRIWYRLDDKNEFSGFFGKMKGTDLTPFKTLRLRFSKDSVLPETFKIEIKDDSPEKVLLGSLEVKGARAGETLEIDLSPLTAKAVKTGEFLFVFDRKLSGKNPVGLFDIDEAVLTAEVPAGPRSELRILPEDPDTEWIERGFSRHHDEDEELLALTDPESGALLAGTAKPKSRVHADGDWHAVTHVYLFDSRGRILLQERSLSKQISPGKLQVSAGGHVNASETRVEAIVRETREELGITLDAARLVLLTPENGYGREFRQTGVINREYVTVYVYVLSDAEKASIEVNHEEIQRAVFVSSAFFEKLAAQKPEILSGSLNLLMREKRGLYEEMLKIAAPNSPRSELRGLEADVLDAVLTSVALRAKLDPDSARILSDSARRDLQTTASALQDAGRAGVYAAMMAAGQEVMPVITAEAPRTGDSSAGVFTEALLEAFEEDLRGTLESSADKKLTFAFVYRLPEGERARGYFYRYLEILSRLRAAYPSRVTVDIRILALPHELEDEGVKDWIRKAGRLGGAKPVELSAGGVQGRMAGYLAEYGSALVYGLSETGLLEGFARRAVLSEAAPGDEFPVVVVISRLLAEDGKIPLTAERLGRIAAFLPGVLKMQGASLMITRFAAEIASRFEADRLIRQAA